MNLMTDVPVLDLDLDPEPIEEVTPIEAMMMEVRRSPINMHDWENHAVTASWGPLMQEVCALCLLRLPLASNADNKTLSSLATAGDAHRRPC